MAARQIDSIFVKVDVDLSHFRKGFAEMSKILTATSAQLEQISTKIKGMKLVPPDTGAIKNSFNSTISSMKSIANETKALGRQMTVGISLPLALIGSSAIGTFTDYQREILKAKAVTEATTSEFKLMEEAVRKIGFTTEFSASQAADALSQLGQRGMDASKAIQALPTIIDLATAGIVDIGKAAAIATSVMNSMGLEVKDLNRIGNTLAIIGAKSGATIEDLGSSFARMGAIAKITNQDVEDVAAAMGILRDRGIDAGTIGTELRNIFSKLSVVSDKGREALNKYGIEVLGLDRNLKKLPDLVEEFENKLKGLTAPQKLNVLKELMDRRTANQFLALMNAGSAKLRQLSSDAGGTGEELKKMAEIMRSDFQGSFAKMKASIEGFKIDALKAIEPELKAIADTVADLARSFSELSPETKKAILSFILILAAIGPVVWIAGSLASSVLSIISLFSKLSFVLTPITALFSSIWGIISPFVTSILSLGKALLTLNFGAVATWFSALGGSIAGVISWVGRLAVAFGPITVLIGLIIVAIVSLIGAWEDMTDFALMGDILADVWAWIVQIFQDSAEWVGNIILDLWNYINELFSDGVNWIVSLVSGLWRDVSDWFLQGAKEVDAIIYSWIDNIIAFFEPAFDWISEIVSNAWVSISGFFSLWGGKVIAYLETWSVNITNNMSKWKGFIIGIFKSMASGTVQAMVNWPRIMYNFIVGTVEDALNGAIELLNRFWAKLGGTFKIKTFSFGKVKDDFKITFEDMADTAKFVGDEIANKTKEVYQKIKNTIVDTYEDVKNKIFATYEKMISMADSTWTSLKNVAGSTFDWIGDKADKSSKQFFKNWDKGINRIKTSIGLGPKKEYVDERDGIPTNIPVRDPNKKPVKILSAEDIEMMSQFDRLLGTFDEVDESLGKIGDGITDVLVQTIDYMERAGERWAETWLGMDVTAGAVMESLQEASRNLFQSMSEGLGTAMADVLVYGESFTEVMKKLWKSLAAMAIKALVMIGIQAIATMILQKATTKEAGTSAIGSNAGRAFSAGFASVMEALPFPANIAVAPGVAAGAGGAAMAGGLAFIGGSAESGGLITGHGLIEVGEKGKKEVVVPLEGSNKGKGLGGNQTIIVELDGRTLLDTVVRGLPEHIRLRTGSHI